MSRPGTNPWRSLLPLLLVLAGSFPAVPSLAQEPLCVKCHAKLLKDKPVVHAAVTMGCTSCHGNIAAPNKVPHKKITNIPKGLSAEPPELCFNCHDKAPFARKSVHPALASGCLTCHDPHATKEPKLLISAPLELCTTCHDKAPFSRKNIHMPVAGGMCPTCHDPHSSEQFALLAKPLLQLCADCHGEVLKSQHAIAGFVQNGHPVGQAKKDRLGKDIAPPSDPNRQGRPFSCPSCHNPHSSDFRRLFRFAARTTMELCTNCHQY